MCSMNNKCVHYAPFRCLFHMCAVQCVFILIYKLHRSSIYYIVENAVIKYSLTIHYRKYITVNKYMGFDINNSIIFKRALYNIIIYNI